MGQLPSYVAFKKDTMVLFEADRTTRFKRIKNGSYRASLLAPYTGRYYSAELDITYTLIERDGKLLFKRTPFDDPKPVHVLAENALRTTLGEMRLHFTQDGSVKGFDFNAGRVNQIKFRKIK